MLEFVSLRIVRPQGRRVDCALWYLDAQLPPPTSNAPKRVWQARPHGSANFWRQYLDCGAGNDARRG